MPAALAKALRLAKEDRREGLGREPMRFSVITVCLNCEDVLRACLASIDEQTHPDLEHIVVDGASTDGTVALARGFPRTTVLSVPDTGLYDAMNKGIGLATGDFVLFINADDRLADRATLARVARAIAADPGADVYYGWLEVRPRDGLASVFEPPGPASAAEFMVTGCLPHQSTVARRDVFDRTGRFDTRYRIHADYDWYLKVLADPAIDLRALDLAIGSFSEGGASSELGKGQREVFEIQSRSPLYASAEWDRRRIGLLQEAWLAERIESARLRGLLAARGETSLSPAASWQPRVRKLLPRSARSVLRKVRDRLRSGGA